MSDWVFIEPAEKDRYEVMIVPTSDELFKTSTPKWIKVMKPGVKLLIKVIGWF